MAKEHQFDISAKLDFQELKNAIVQTQKECTTRYDFKGIVKDVTFNETAKIVTINSASDNKVDAIYDILISKLNKRGIPINSLDEAKEEDSAGGNRKYTYPLIDSIQKEDAKTIQNEIKQLQLKVKSVNQGDTIRVTGKNIDDLQTVMQHLKSLDIKSPLVFENFR